MSTPWRNVFEDNEGGVDEKALLHAKRWGLYLNEKEKLVKGKYSVEVVGRDKKKVLWEVVGDLPLPLCRRRCRPAAVAAAPPPSLPLTHRH